MPQFSIDEIDRIIAGQHHDPHSILGAHPGPGGITVRALRPLAATVAVVLSDGRMFPMRHVHDGVFEAILPPGDVPDYRLAVGYPGDSASAASATDPEKLDDDPYRQLPTLGAIDLHLISEGRHEQLWKVLGAHVRTLPSGASAGAGRAQAAPAPTRASVTRPVPGTATPSTAVPGTATSSTAVPGIVTPGAATPGITAPVGVTPGAATPSTATFGGARPDGATPDGAAPDGATPGGGSATKREPLRSNNHARPGFAPVTGVSFAVWAPNARGVRVISDFNRWDGRGHPMRSLGSSGVWELFVPGAEAGMRYKYEICGPDGIWRVKADPMAQAAEHPPATASIIYESDYTWDDASWLAARAERNQHRGPMSFYEVHLGSWRPGLSYRELADELTEYVTSMGFTHVEFLPVAEHPFGGSWGYQISSYYAPTARFGSPDDFRYLLDRLHQAGIGVFLDWVPAHFPRDEWALARFDGTPLYEHPDPRRGEHPDWGTYVFNYGRNEVRNFLVANALYWFEEFHIDGLRVDAVASMLYLDYSRAEGQWTPNIYGGRENLDAISFLKEVNATAYRRAPGISMIAEESTAWPGVTRPVHLGGLGFGFKWNMGWMHDTLGYLSHDPVFRTYHHSELTFSLIYAFSENFVLPLSHDEVVHGKGSLLGKMPGDDWRRFAGLRALLGYMWAHPGKQLLFMGSEFGQGAEWSEEHGLDWWALDDDFHRGVQQLVRDLNRVYGETPALWQLDSSPEGFAWIDANDAGGNTVSFLRLAPTVTMSSSGVSGPGARAGATDTGPGARAGTTDNGTGARAGATNSGPSHASRPHQQRTQPRQPAPPTADPATPAGPTNSDPATPAGPTNSDPATPAGPTDTGPAIGVRADNSGPGIGIRADNSAPSTGADSGVADGPAGTYAAAAGTSAAATGTTVAAARTSDAAAVINVAADQPGPRIIACIVNFSAVPHTNYRIGLPQAGRWREVINTDAPIYGGSGVGNLGMIEAVPEPCHGKPASATLTVPPLGVLWLVPE